MYKGKIQRSNWKPQLSVVCDRQIDQAEEARYNNQKGIGRAFTIAQK